MSCNIDVVPLPRLHHIAYPKGELASRSVRSLPEVDGYNNDFMISQVHECPNSTWYRFLIKQKGMQDYVECMHLIVQQNLRPATADHFRRLKRTSTYHARLN